MPAAVLAFSRVASSCKKSGGRGGAEKVLYQQVNELSLEPLAMVPCCNEQPAAALRR